MIYLLFIQFVTIRTLYKDGSMSLWYGGWQTASTLMWLWWLFRYSGIYGVVDCIMVTMATIGYHVAHWIDFTRYKVSPSLWPVCVVRFLWRVRQWEWLWATPSSRNPCAFHLAVNSSHRWLYRANLLSVITSHIAVLWHHSAPADYICGTVYRPRALCCLNMPTSAYLLPFLA